MTEYAFHVKLVALLNESILRETYAITQGSASDFADYKERCGRIDGLREAIDLAGAVNRTLSGQSS